MNTIKKLTGHRIIKSKYLELLPKFKQENTQKFTTLILTLFAFSFFGFFAINPTLSTIAELKKELSDNQLVNRKLEEKIKNLSTLQQKYSLLNESLPRIFSAVPEKPSLAVLVGQLQAISKENNVNITRLQTFEVELPKKEEKTDNPKTADDYSYFVFSLGLDGSYDNLLNFISVLVDFDRIITIDSLSVNKAAGKDILEMDIKGKAYFKK